MTATIIRADARALPLPDASVDLIVTSPPYFALRSYTDGGEHYAGQIGGEPTPREYIAALLDCTREWMRVLKPCGSIFVNLGDKYSGNAPGAIGATGSKTAYTRDGYRSTTGMGARDKSLMFLPERYRIGCVDELGLIARAVLVWSKPNGLPESVTDRVRRSHEDWVHLTKLPRYFSAVDEIREEYSPNKPWGTGGKSGAKIGAATAAARGHRPDQHQTGLGTPSARVENPLGKLPGSVWEVATEPLKVPAELGVDHFAAFPTEWPRRIILGWSPSGICTACGEGRRPVVDRKPIPKELKEALAAKSSPKRNTDRNDGGYQYAIGGPQLSRPWRAANPETITGEACACPTPDAPTRPAVVLDPFGGTGTTALVASVLGRHGISVDMSADYCRLAQWRTTDPAQRAKAARVAAPPKQLEGQSDLLDLIA